MARRWLKRLFGTVHLTRDEPSGTGHMYVLPWEVKRYTPSEVPYLPVSHVPPGYRGEDCYWRIDTADGGQQIVRARLRGPHAVQDDDL